MAKTLANLRSMTRTYLDESSEADFLDTEITREINEGYHKTVTAVMTVFEDYYMTSTTVDTVEDQQEYGVTDGMPSDLLKIRRVELNYNLGNNSTPLRALPFNIDEIRRDLANTGVGMSVIRNPGYYSYGFGSNLKIGFIPIPTEAGTDAIKLFYIPIKSDLSSETDNVDVPYADRFAPIIPLYAAGMMLRKGQQDEGVSARYLAEFEAGLMKMQEELEDKVAEEGKTIIDTVCEITDFSDFSSLY